MLVPSLRRMIEPFPYSFSMEATARSMALPLFFVSSMAKYPRGERPGLAALKRFSPLLRIRSAFKIPMANTLEGRMGEEPPGNNQQGEFDVVLLHRATADGEGAHVLRARPG